MSQVDVIKRRGKLRDVSRELSRTYANGFAVPGTTEHFRITCHDQSLTGTELRNLPPGQNAIDWRVVWSIDEVRLRDVIGLDDGSYVVQRINQWPLHWQASVSKVRDTL